MSWEISEKGPQPSKGENIKVRGVPDSGFVKSTHNMGEAFLVSFLADDLDSDVPLPNNEKLAEVSF